MDMHNKNRWIKETSHKKELGKETNEKPLPSKWCLSSLICQFEAATWMTAILTKNILKYTNNTNVYFSYITVCKWCLGTLIWQSEATTWVTTMLTKKYPQIF